MAYNLFVKDKQEAETVLKVMTEVISKYNAVSVSDLHDMLGLSSTYIDSKQGWTSMTNIEIRQTRDGYLIDLPSTEPI